MSRYQDIDVYVDTNIENWEVKLEEREGGLVADRRLGTGCCWRHWRPAVLVELVHWWWSWCTVELVLVQCSGAGAGLHWRSWSWYAEHHWRTFPRLPLASAHTYYLSLFVQS